MTPDGRRSDLVVQTVMGEVDIAVGRLMRFAAGLGLDEMALRLIVLTVWTDSVARTNEEKTGEVRRRLMRAAGA